MILWEVEDEHDSANTIADGDEAIDEERRYRTLTANVYRGPYTGHAKVRRFLVVHEGIRSCYCLYGNSPSAHC